MINHNQIILPTTSKDKLTEGFILDKTKRVEKQAREERADLDAQLRAARAQLLQFSASQEKQGVLEQERVRLEALLAQALADLAAERALLEEAHSALRGLAEDAGRKAASIGHLQGHSEALQEQVSAAALAHAAELQLLETHMDAMAQAGAGTEAKLSAQLADAHLKLAALHQTHQQEVLALQSSAAEVTSGLYAQLAEKDRAHSETLRALQAQLESASRERDEARDGGAKQLLAAQSSSTETLALLRGQLAQQAQAHEAAVAMLQLEIAALGASCRDLEAQKTANLEQVAALQSTTSESALRLSAQLSDQHKQHAAESKTLQLQIDAAASGHASEKAALLQQLTAADIHQQRLADARAEELASKEMAVQAVTRQLTEQSLAAKNSAEVALVKADFLESCLKQERKAVRELRDALAAEQAAHTSTTSTLSASVETLQADLVALRTSTAKDEQHVLELEMLQRSALDKEDAWGIARAALEAEVAEVQEQLLALQDAHLGLQGHVQVRCGQALTLALTLTLS